MAAVNLLLMGRSGNGKSSVGNSILGRKEFTPRSVTSSINYVIKKETVILGGKTVAVVDGPGIGDNITDVTDDGKSMTELIEEALSLIANEFHALIFVLKYGVRFTNQEKAAVKMIKAIFGEDIFRNYGIIMMSYGDSFDIDMEYDKLTFEAWCSQQTGDIQILFNECGERYILFNNKSTNQSVFNKQNEQLMKMVTDITKSRQPYGKEDFKNAEHGRIKLRVMGKLPELESTNEIFLNSLTKQLEQIVDEKNSDHARNIQELTSIYDNVEKHVQFLEKKDQGTGSIGNLLLKINIIKTRVKTMTDLQTLRLKSAEIEKAEPSRKSSVPLPRKTQPDSPWRRIGEVGFAIRRFSESARLALWINFERIKSAPCSWRSIFIYMTCLSIGGFIFYNFYGRSSAKKLTEITNN